MHGHQMKVYDFDFSPMDEEIKIFIEENREAIEDEAHFTYIDHLAEEKRKKREYMKYIPNRDYENRYKDELLKKP